MCSSDLSENMIEIEFCDGINFSTLYVNEILSTSDLDLLLSNIEKLHNYTESDHLYDEYFNFQPKFTQRMSSYDYEKLGISESEVKEIEKGLLSISEKGFIKVMIHGDAVFSNIISLPNNQLKFVDVRGIENGKGTCFGHPLYEIGRAHV